jgi:hypothetical protein
MLDVSSEKLPPKALPQTNKTITRETDILQCVFQTLVYADVFDYPLTAPEVYRYLTATKATFEEVSRVLSEESHFSQVREYFTLRGREHIVDVRKRRTEVAARLWPKAVRYGRIIALLPFVRMVAVTGSLSMNNTDEGNDVDYMIVTAPSHLWTCRALTLLAARIAKLEGVRLCPNYLVTTNALEFKEQSLYVAHEVAQIIPLSGMETYDEMRRRNDWVYDYLPNATGASARLQDLNPTAKTSVVQRILEFVFRLPIFRWVEKWEMNRKIKRLTREQSSSYESYFSADVCKGHIDRHGETVVTALAVRLKNATIPAPADGDREVTTPKAT